MIPTINCLYVVAPNGEGATESWKVVGDNNKTYIVKFNNNPGKVAINELVCYNIAKYLDLPVLDPAIIVLDSEQCAVINKTKKEQILPGKHFGVEMIQPFYNVDNYQKTFSTKLSKNIISNLEKIPDIFGFDTYVQNHDRHCSNVCILENKKTKDKYDYYIFDHSHAFAGPTWFAQIIKEQYKNFSIIRQFCPITDDIKRMAQFDKFFRLLKNLRNDMDKAFEDLPKEWTDTLTTDMDELRMCLTNIQEDKIRDTIKSSKALLNNMM